MPASTSAPDGVLTVTVEPGEPSLVALAGRAIEDGKALVGAEIALAKAKAGERLTAYRSAITFFAIAAVLTLATLVALLVGLIMTLATVIGPGFATAVVVGVALAIAGVMAIIGKGRLAVPAARGAA